MIANTADTLSRGMTILTEQMGIVEAETFLFLVKSESSITRNGNEITLEVKQKKS